MERPVRHMATRMVLGKNGGFFDSGRIILTGIAEKSKDVNRMH